MWKKRRFWGGGGEGTDFLKDWTLSDLRKILREHVLMTEQKISKMANFNWSVTSQTDFKKAFDN